MTKNKTFIQCIHADIDDKKQAHVALVIGIIITLSILLSTSVIIRQITFAKVQSFTDSNFDTLYANPGAYVNSQANITAKVFSLPSSDVGSKKVLQVYQGGK